MYRGAIGIIETIGHVGSVEAADAMTKCAEVRLLGREDIGGGYHAVCVRGDVGSVRAALEAGRAAAERVGRVVGVLFIPRPHDELRTVLVGFDPQDDGPPLAEADLSSMNVHELRNLARRIPDLPIKGREVSRANRQQLVDALHEHLTRHEESDGEEGDRR